MKDLFIADLGKFENQVVTGFFTVTTRQVRSKKDGVPYFALVLCDSTGQVECRMWEIADAQEFVAGDVVKARGQVSRYQDKLQLTLDKIRRAETSEYDLADFLPKTTRDIDELWAELNGYVASFTNPHLQALLRAFLDDPEIASVLRNAPAAKSMHHAWIGGLLEHIVSLLGIADLAAHHYTEINRDLLLTGVVLHDIGKLQELRWGTSFDYTIEGQLLGHISIGIGMVEKKLANLPNFPDNLRVLVKHIILSHHGKYEFGSPKLPMVPEALLLHYLDDLDAKMQTMRSEFGRAEAQGRAPGQMTEWVRAMERPLLDTATHLGDQPVTMEAEPAPEEEANALPVENRAVGLFDE